MALPAGLRILPLWQVPARLPELAEQLARQRLKEGLPADSAALASALTRELQRPTALPQTLVAVAERRLLGCVLLTRQRGRLAPADALWLASLWVHADYRRQGLGAQLVEHLLALAGNFQAPEVYLYTRHQADYFQRLGWQPVRATQLRHKPVALLFYSLANGAAGT